MPRVQVQILTFALHVLSPLPSTSGSFDLLVLLTGEPGSHQAANSYGSARTRDKTFTVLCGRAGSSLRISVGARDQLCAALRAPDFAGEDAAAS